MTRIPFRYSCLTAAMAIMVAMSPVNAQENTPTAPDAQATLMNTDGEITGEVRITNTPHGVLLNIDAFGLIPGKHGLHIHRVGTCDANEGFTTAKGHVMPDDTQHGFINPDGYHAGDLPNLIVDDTGHARVELFTSTVMLNNADNALLDDDGASIVIHAQPDDHLTQPIGGAGDRVACGVITADM